MKTRSVFESLNLYKFFSLDLHNHYIITISTIEVNRPTGVRLVVNSDLTPHPFVEKLIMETLVFKSHKCFD